MQSTLLVYAGSQNTVLELMGPASARVSATLLPFVEQTMAGGMPRVQVDLAGCTGVDSTFLGCLLRLQRDHPGFSIACPSEAARKVFTSTRLDAVLRIVDHPLTHQRGTGVPLGIVDGEDPVRMGRHVLACHRAMLQVDGPHQEACTAVVRHLTDGLGEESA